MPDPAAIHVVVAAWALFVGSFQLVMRWLWSSNFRRQDRIAMRLWSLSTMTTAAVIALTMYYFRDDPIDRWFYLVVLIVVAKSVAAAWAVVALRGWWREAHTQRLGKPPHVRTSR